MTTEQMAAQMRARILRSPWHAASLRTIRRPDGGHGKDCDLEPAVNFFIEALEAVGARTLHSCTGHEDGHGGFYVMFEAPYETARRVARAGTFAVRIFENECHTGGTWLLELSPNFKFMDRRLETLSKEWCLAMASERWQRELLGKEWGDKEAIREAADAWERHTLVLSGIGPAERMHPSYLALVSMGVPAVPAILRRARDGCVWHWMNLLADILGECPQIPCEDRGVTDRVLAHTLAWAKTLGYEPEG